jgi:hypothetical protein
MSGGATLIQLSAYVFVVQERSSFGQSITAQFDFDLVPACVFAAIRLSLRFFLDLFSRLTIW